MEDEMATAGKMTSADLELLPDDGKRYELIEGELYVSGQPGSQHQCACGQLCRFLQERSEETGSGVALIAPGLIFAEDDDVAPDVVWVSNERLAQALDEKGICVPRRSWSWRFCRPARRTSAATGRLS